MIDDSKSFSPRDTRGLPLYHENKVIVRMRPVARPVMSVLSAGLGEGTSGGAFEPPGASALSTLHRAGLIRRVTPVAVEASRRGPFDGPRAAFSALSASLEVPDGNSNSGVNVVEFQRGNDIGQIQLALANDPLVEYVGRIPLRYLLARSATGARASGLAATVAVAAPPASTLWNLKKIRWAEASTRRGFKDASTIKVAVLDSGVDPNHPDLAGRIADYSHTYADLPNNPSDQDVIGHGTHVTGTISALVNDVGINGISSAPIYMHKIFPDGASATFYNATADMFAYGVDPIMYLRSLKACLDQGVRVVNLSIGGYGEPDLEEARAFQTLVDAGVTIVAAMGNENTSQPSYPAAIPGVIAVGATSIDDTRSTFSNYGSHMAVCAPGEGIWSTLPTYPGNLGYRNAPDANGKSAPGAPITRPGGTDYAAWQGTSMATPHVTAAVALLLANKPSITTSAAIRSALTSSVAHVPGMGGAAFSKYYGSGRLDLYTLLS